MRFSLRENKWVWQVSVLSVVLGMLLAAALKTQTWIRSTMNIPTGRLGPLAQMVLDEKEKNSQAQERIKQLQEQVSDYEQAKGADSLLKKELEKAKLLAGLTAVRGQGLEVTLQDSRKRPPADVPPELIQLYNIHDADLRDFVHLLFANGAEAISIKDADSEQRVVLATGIICTNGTIRINSVRMGPPFVIKAISTTLPFLRPSHGLIPTPTT